MDEKSLPGRKSSRLLFSHEEGRKIGPPVFFWANGMIWRREAGIVIIQGKEIGLSVASLDRSMTRARKAARLGGRVNVLVAGNAQCVH